MDLVLFLARQMTVPLAVFTVCRRLGLVDGFMQITNVPWRMESWLIDHRSGGDEVATVSMFRVRASWLVDLMACA